MELSPETTPLGLVQQTLCAHTDRNPADATAVMATIRSAVRALDERHVDALEDHIGKSLDEHTPGGLGLHGTAAIRAVGELASDPAASREQVWGALSLLGVLASTHNPDVYTTDEPDPRAMRALLPSALSREALEGVLYRKEDITGAHRAVIGTFLGRTGVPPLDVAIEFEIEGLRQSNAPEIEEPTIDQELLEAVELQMGSSITEPYPYELFTQLPGIDTKLESMPWLKQVKDLNTVPARDIYHDGTHIVTVLDLTPGSKTLHDLHREFAEQPHYEQFWPQMSASIIRFVEKGHANDFKSAHVPTKYMANKGSNATIMRGYYTALGNHPETGIRTFGLIAAFASKQNQPKVFRLIGTFKHPRLSER